MADPVPYVSPAPTLPAGYAADPPDVPTPQTTYTQTYATVATVVPVATAAAVATTGASAVTPFGYTTAAQANAIVAAINALIVDALANRQLLNALIDDLQASGISL